MRARIAHSGNDSKLEYGSAHLRLVLLHMFNLKRVWIQLSREALTNNQLTANRSFVKEQKILKIKVIIKGLFLQMFLNRNTNTLAGSAFFSTPQPPPFALLKRHLLKHSLVFSVLEHA